MAKAASLEIRETDAGISLTGVFPHVVEITLASDLREKFAKRALEVVPASNAMLLYQHDFE